MGWTIYYHTPANIRDEIARLSTWDNEHGRGFPVLIRNVGSVWYAACRCEPVGGRLATGTDKTGRFDTDLDGAYTFALVFLTTGGNGQWGYKDMDETMGPHESEAPAQILDALSPTTSEYALAWRARCRDHAARPRRSP